eukprot:CAMPEP_0198138886 /NCGR_PEP_ID=MMETSP1443-20131203/2271_1 /TAXON_ID=186043 /ORGANISM="Entomoneis sp., Strain CCMP2396" /LENGTH=391 /DNA_ID=CAMNT_0043800843 /DNA_START=191 /DNA_END=1366 /DNA_ORIENTATION=-
MPSADGIQLSKTNSNGSSNSNIRDVEKNEQEESSSSNVVHAQKADSSMNMATFKLVLLVGMVLQNSATVLVGRYTRSNGAPAEDLYEVSHLILICELSKFILSCGLEMYTSQGKFMESVKLHVLDRPMDALKISVPAGLYLVQNTLLYVALSNLTAPMFQVTYQSKLVTTAICSVILLQRSYNARQWLSLVGISLGVAFVVLGERKAEDEEEDSEKGVNLSVGLVAVTVACFSSAMAGVYFEKVLKKPATHGAKVPNASVWMRNMQLAFFSVIIALFQGGLKTSASGKSYLHGFDMWVWILVLLQSCGGLLVAAVIKYADNVLKGLATGVSVVLSSGLSMLIFNTPLGPKFAMGGALIMTSVWFFSNPLPTWCVPKEQNYETAITKNLLPK